MGFSRLGHCSNLIKTHNPALKKIVDETLVFHNLLFDYLCVCVYIMCKSLRSRAMSSNGVVWDGAKVQWMVDSHIAYRSVQKLVGNIYDCFQFFMITVALAQSLATPIKCHFPSQLDKTSLGNRQCYSTLQCTRARC